VSKITWLHLSDLHFQTTEQHASDTDIVLRSLLDDVQNRIAKHSGGPRNPVFGSPSGDVFQKKRLRWETSPVRIGKTGFLPDSKTRNILN